MNSLPFLTRLIAATILARQNKFLIAENAYLRTEIAYYREQAPPERRNRFTDAWRKRFARLGPAIGMKRLAEVATIAKAKTIYGWKRLLKAGQLGNKRRGVGRPRTDDAIEKVVLRLARENPTWGQLRIAATLILLLIPLSPRTIAAILNRHGMKPAPDRSTDWTWKRFISAHLHELAATDFFTVDVAGRGWSWLRTQTVYVLFAIHLGSRKVEILGITDHPNEAFMVQVARNCTMVDTGWFKRMGIRRLIHDGDGKFCPHWQHTPQEAEVTPVQIPPHSPNCNAFAERWVRTVKRECLRRIWLIGIEDLRQALAEFVRHYNTERPHQGIGNKPLDFGPQPPAQKSVAGGPLGRIRCRTSCGGVIRHYYRDAA
jgi:transposase InsO family protein